MPDGGRFLVRSDPPQRLRRKPARRGTGGPSSGVRHPTDWLTLPRVPRQVGLPINADGQDEKTARLARTLLKAGLLRSGSERDPLSKLVGDSLHGWMQWVWNTGSPLRYFKLEAHLYPSIFSLNVRDSVDSLLDGYEEDLRCAFREDFGMELEREHIAVLFEAEKRTDVNLKDGVLRLEAACPGLGFEVAKTVEDIGVEFGLLGGRWIADCARNVYWGGGESEHEWASDYGETLEGYEGMTRKEFDELMPPEWLSPERMPVVALEAARSTAGGKAAVAADLVLKLRASDTEGFRWGRLAGLLEWREFLCPNVILWWDDSVGLDRAVDDYVEMVMQSEYQELPGIGLALMPTDDASWFERVGAEWRKKAETLARLDALLGLIGKDTR